jgi:hypothetical protein
MALTYHNRRIRDTCFGAGHVHCEHCDLAISAGTTFSGDIQGLCSSCAKNALTQYPRLPMSLAFARFKSPGAQPREEET